MQDLGIGVLIEGKNMERLLMGLLVTARIALAAVIFSIIFGTLFGILMTKKSPLIRFLCRFYLEAIRIIPVLVWLFLFYFGLARNFHINLSGELTCVIVFTLWGTAEMGDLVRGAITSLSKHQYESGFALGLSAAQLYRFIIVPQAVRRLMPGAINLATRMIKTSSLAVLIGVVEVLKVGQQIIESNFLKSPSAAFWVYLFIFFLYFALCMPVSQLSKRLEQKWQN
ncbi:MAG: amino acid ABC transporter permease [Spirochaetaceae bacterium]|jgi:polar amino acid transport system permease protein|nr:amino acid ABC transporter permease [Spirochaetaceae bacterium]